jgi:antitoxin component YwqK of YwqJK toxin-antitoxin module
MTKIRIGILLLGLIGVGAIVYLQRTQPMPEEVTAEPELALQYIERREGQMFRSGSTNPFTGRVIERYRDGVLKSQTEVQNGMLHGVSEGWYTNAQMQVREFFVNGVSHGTRLKWYDSGKQLSEAPIENGELHGVFRKWHDNGKPMQEITMRRGRAHGRSRAWYESGYLKAEVAMEEGEVSDRKEWKDGEKPGDAD